MPQSGEASLLPRLLACGVIAAALLLAALLAGCGGSAGGGAQPSSALSQDHTFQETLKAAVCMRANGVPNYPDPKLVNGIVRLSFLPGVNPTTPAVQRGAKKCGYQNELRAEETQSRIAFVRCVRTHGVRNFPYPTADGGVSVEMVEARGINPQSPAVARVVSECLPPWLRPPTTP